MNPVPSLEIAAALLVAALLYSTVGHGGGSAYGIGSLHPRELYSRPPRNLGSTVQLRPDLPLWAGAVLVGGWLGSTYGSRRLPSIRLRQMLAVVLLVAAVKFALT